MGYKQQIGEGLGPRRLGGGGAPRPLQNRFLPGLPSPAPQIWPANRISSSLPVLVETGQQGTPHFSLVSPCPQDNHHPFPPKGSGHQGVIRCGRQQEKGVFA